MANRNGTNQLKREGSSPDSLCIWSDAPLADWLIQAVRSSGLKVIAVGSPHIDVRSCSGMSHNLLAAQIARQATVVGTNDEFAVVFAAIGVQYSEAEYRGEEMGCSSDIFIPSQIP